MNDELIRYLTQAYRRDVLHESVGVEIPSGPEIIALAKAELQRINALGLGSSLAQRDFASYQSKRALERLLSKLEEDV